MLELRLWLICFACCLCGVLMALLVIVIIGVVYTWFLFVCVCGWLCIGVIACAVAVFGYYCSL